MRILISLFCLNMVLSSFLTFTNLIVCKIVIALICSSLITNQVELPSIIYLYSLPFLLSNCFLTIIRSSLYILGTNPMPVIYVINIVFLFIAWFLTLCFYLTTSTFLEEWMKNKSLRKRSFIFICPIWAVLSSIFQTKI